MIGKLARLTIRNIQAYRKVVFDFSPGITAIVGVTDSGKTTLVRALKLLVENRPLGAKWYNDAAPSKGTMSVRGEFDDGVSVLLKRRVSRGKTGKKKVVPGSPEYQVKLDRKANVKKLNGFRASVPKEVSSALNLDTINFQKQFDSSFLIEEGGGKIARAINELIQAEDVDKWQGIANSTLNSAKTALKLAESELSGIDEELEQLSNLDKVESTYKKYRQRRKRLEQLDEKIDDLERIADELEECEQSIKDIAPSVKAFDLAIYGYKESVGPVANELSKVEHILDNVGTYLLCEKDIKRVEAALAATEEKYHSLMANSGVCPFCGREV